MIVAEKLEGETPLECLERVRKEQKIGPEIPMTYAGRLDPMASGKLLILVGEECKQKEQYLGLDKEYEVEILFGIATDTQDLLGLIGKVSDTAIVSSSKINLQNYVGSLLQTYPIFSSKTINGKQLHVHARAGTLPHSGKMPSRKVTIYSITELGRQIKTGAQIAAIAIENISKVKGDFRQEEIIAGWKKFFLDNASQFGSKNFGIVKIRVSCGSGTYMRSLAERMGNDIGTGAITLSIKRTGIGDY